MECYQILQIRAACDVVRPGVLSLTARFLCQVTLDCSNIQEHTGKCSEYTNASVDRFQDNDADYPALDFTEVHKETGFALKAYHWPVQYTEDHNGHACEDNIVGCSTDAVHQSLATETVVELVVEQKEPKDDVFIERVLDEATEPVGRQRAMNQQQPYLQNYHVRW